jgi:hypothetical protein
MGVFIALFGVLILFMMFVVGQSANDFGYSQGYCIALGGQRITNDVCDVSGRTVVVKK